MHVRQCGHDDVASYFFIPLLSHFYLMAVPLDFTFFFLYCHKRPIHTLLYSLFSVVV